VEHEQWLIDQPHRHASLKSLRSTYFISSETVRFTMLAFDPAMVAVKNFPPWAITLTGFVVAAALLMQHVRSSKCKSHVKPRKIHSLRPIFGDMLEVSKNIGVRHDWLTAVCLRFRNEPWQISIAGTPKMIVISDPATVEAVTVTQFDNFVKGITHRAIMRDFLGDGIVNADGE
jgi:hypothetical protein